MRILHGQAKLDRATHFWPGFWQGTFVSAHKKKAGFEVRLCFVGYWLLRAGRPRSQLQHGVFVHECIVADQVHETLLVENRNAQFGGFFQHFIVRVNFLN